ncbi:MAG: ABC transporter permease subunit [Actinomycetota bacterium]|nr:ABC transporter permease subunit [Actinomycetota bacterium]
MTAATPTASAAPPLWRNVRVLRWAFQAGFLLVVTLFLLYLWGNLTDNLERLGVRTDFRYLRQPAGFAIPDSDFRSSQSIFQALLVGAQNTAKVAFLGILLATVLGVVVGVARLSTNWLVRRTAALYVESLRNIPVLIIIIFWWAGVFLNLRPFDEGSDVLGILSLSNRGLALPWFERSGGVGIFLAVLAVALALAAFVVWWRTRRFDATGEPHHRVLWAAAVLVLGVVAAYFSSGRPFALSLPEQERFGTIGGFRLSPEFGALLIALVLYTASHIAEIVRGSILAVQRGQSEAATALGLSGFQRMRYVVLPQAFRISVPPMANQYLNLTKNSSLGIAIGYYEMTRISGISISQGGPAPQAILVLMLFYLAFSLFIALVTNLINRRLEIKGR